jgi:prefoldin subunit 5
MAGIVTFEQATDRIEQLELQIEYLQEHIDSLDGEVASMEREQGTVHAAILHEKKQLLIDLESEKSKNKVMMKNLKQLETMINELNSMKTTKSILLFLILFSSR